MGRGAGRKGRFRLHGAGGRVELARLVKFAVVGQIGLGNHAEDASSVDNHRAIEQQMSYLQRRTHHDDHRPRRRGLANLTQTLAAAVEHRPLMEQIVAGVGRNPQLGEKCKYYLTFDRLLRQRDGFGGVESRIGNCAPRGIPTATRTKS